MRKHNDPGIYHEETGQLIGSTSIEDYPQKLGKACRAAITENGLLPARWTRPEPVTGDRWGEWVFNRRNLTLYHARARYEIDLERINTSAQLSDWIFQITKKPRSSMSIEDIGNLCTALQDLLDPQRNLCGCERDKQQPKGWLRARYTE